MPQKYVDHPEYNLPSRTVLLYGNEILVPQHIRRIPNGWQVVIDRRAGGQPYHSKAFKDEAKPKELEILSDKAAYKVARESLGKAAIYLRDEVLKKYKTTQENTYNHILTSVRKRGMDFRRPDVVVGKRTKYLAAVSFRIHRRVNSVLVYKSKSILSYSFTNKTYGEAVNYMKALDGYCNDCLKHSVKPSIDFFERITDARRKKYIEQSRVKFPSFNKLLKEVSVVELKNRTKRVVKIKLKGVKEGVEFKSVDGSKTTKLYKTQYGSLAAFRRAVEWAHNGLTTERIARRGTKSAKWVDGIRLEVRRTENASTLYNLAAISNSGKKRTLSIPLYGGLQKTFYQALLLNQPELSRYKMKQKFEAFRSVVANKHGEEFLKELESLATK